MEPRHTISPREIAILLRAQAEAGAVLARLRIPDRLLTDIASMQKRMAEMQATLGRIGSAADAFAAMRAALVPGALQAIQALSAPQILDAMTAHKKALDRIAPSLEMLSLEPAFSSPTLLTPAAALLSTSGAVEPVYVPEDDPRYLRDQLAARDAQIAELEAELRAMRFADALGGEPYDPPMEPDWFGNN